MSYWVYQCLNKDNEKDNNLYCKPLNARFQVPLSTYRHCVSLGRNDGRVVSMANIREKMSF